MVLNEATEGLEVQQLVVSTLDVNEIDGVGTNGKETQNTMLH